MGWSARLGPRDALYPWADDASAVRTSLSRAREVLFFAFTHRHELLGPTVIGFVTTTGFIAFSFFAISLSFFTLSWIARASPLPGALLRLILALR